MFGNNINQSGEKIDPALAAALEKQGLSIPKARIAKPVVDRSIRIEQAKREVAHGANTTRAVGDWTRYLANEEIERDGELTSAALHFDAPQWPSVVREVFSDLYQAPGDAVLDADQQPIDASVWVASAVDAITHVPEWIDLRARTQGDEWASGLAVNAVSKRMADQLESIVPGSDLRAAHDQLQTMLDLLEEAQKVETGGGAPVPEKLKQLVADAQANAAATAKDDMTAGAAITRKKHAIQAIASMVAKEVVAQIDTVKSAMRSLGAGSMAGRGLRVNAPAKQLHERLRKNPKLARVAALAGRLKAEAAKKQATKTQYAREEVTSITVGSDVARLVPSELTIDESGSMAGREPCRSARRARRAEARRHRGDDRSLQRWRYGDRVCREARDRHRREGEGCERETREGGSRDRVGWPRFVAQPSDRASQPSEGARHGDPRDRDSGVVRGQAARGVLDVHRNLRSGLRARRRDRRRACNLKGNRS
jgi:hypothetical protein